MDQSIQYARVMSNFDSVYNVIPHSVHSSISYVPMTSSSTYHNRSVSPPSLTSSSAKFNFDLYNPTVNLPRHIDVPSPSSSVIVHHHPVHYHSSPPRPPPSQAISKLRQINDELSHTLAKCELANHSQPLPLPLPSPSHYFIHHHPISHETRRSYSSSERDSSSSSIEDVPVKRKHNARIQYKAHIPRRATSLSNLDQVLISTSDAYSLQDPMTVDFYPTRDQGFIRKIRDRPDNQTPWLDNTSPIQRNSFSPVSIYRTPKTPTYSDMPIQPRSRLASGKERSRSSSTNPRIRRDSAPSPLRRSTTNFSTSAPVWRPNGSIKQPKFIGCHAPPAIPKPRVKEPIWNPTSVTIKTKHFHALDPTSKPSEAKTNEPIWKPSNKSISRKPPKYFEPTIKPEVVTAKSMEKEAQVKRKKVNNEIKIPKTNSALKTRFASAESKVKSAWQGTTTNATAPRPPIPIPPKSTTKIAKPSMATTKITKTSTATTKPFVSPPKTTSKKVAPTPEIDVDTGRSSLNNVPAKPLFQSTPKDRSMANDDFEDLFENESQASESSRKPDIPHQPPQIEKTPPKLPQKNMPESDKKSKSVIKDDVSEHIDSILDNSQQNEHTPSPRSELNNNDEDKEEENLPSHHSIPPPSTAAKDTAPLPTNKPSDDNDASIVGSQNDSINEDINKSDNNEDEGYNISDNASLDGSKRIDMDSTLAKSEKAKTTIPSRSKETSPTPAANDVDEFFD